MMYTVIYFIELSFTVKNAFKCFISYSRLSVPAELDHPSDIDQPPSIKKRRYIANDIHIMILTCL